MWTDVDQPLFLRSVFRARFVERLVFASTVDTLDRAGTAACMSFFRARRASWLVLAVSFEMTILLALETCSRASGLAELGHLDCASEDSDVDTFKIRLQELLGLHLRCYFDHR